MIYFNYVLSRYDLLQLCALLIWPTSIVCSLDMTYFNCVLSWYDLHQLCALSLSLYLWPTSIVLSLSMTYCNCVISMTYFNCMWSIWPTSTVCDLYDLLQLCVISMTYFNSIALNDLLLIPCWKWPTSTFCSLFGFPSPFWTTLTCDHLMLLVTVLLCRPMTFWRTFKWLTKTNLFIQMYEDSYVN